MKSAFLTDLVAKKVEDGWVLEAPLIYYSKLLDYNIIAETNEHTDFASVPRIPGVFAVFGDTATKPAVIHDHLYKTHQTTRKQADDVFYEAMRSIGMNWWKASAMHLAVRIGGFIAWKKGGK